jgi:hypothetical protein
VDIAEDPINFLIEVIQIQHFMRVLRLEVIGLLLVTLYSIQQVVYLLISLVEFL